MRRTIVSPILSIAVVTVTTGCRGPSEPSIPRPDHFGAFVLSSGHLHELNKISHASVSQVSGGTGASEFDAVPDLVTAANLSFITYGLSKPVLARASEPGRSKTYKVGGAIPLEIEAIEGEREMLRVTPNVLLPSDVYLLSAVGCLDNGWNARCYFSIFVP